MIICLKIWNREKPIWARENVRPKAGHLVNILSTNTSVFVINNKIMFLNRREIIITAFMEHQWDFIVQHLFTFGRRREGKIEPGDLWRTFVDFFFYDPLRIFTVFIFFLWCTFLIDKGNVADDGKWTCLYKYLSQSHNPEPIGNYGVCKFSALCNNISCRWACIPASARPLAKLTTLFILWYHNLSRSLHVVS